MITEEVVLKQRAQYLTFPPAPMPDQALEVWQAATKFYSKSYLAWLTYVDLLMSASHLPTNCLNTDLPVVQQRKTNLGGA